MRGRMLLNGRVRPVGCYNGCSCHNSKELRRKGKKAAKQAERRVWQREVA